MRWPRPIKHVVGRPTHLGNPAPLQEPLDNDLIHVASSELRLPLRSANDAEALVQVCGQCGRVVCPDVGQELFVRLGPAPRAIYPYRCAVCAKRRLSLVYRRAVSRRCSECRLEPAKNQPSLFDLKIPAVPR